MKRLPRFLHAASVGLVIGLVLLGLWIFLAEPNMLTLRRTEIELPDLPPELDGMRIAFISDLHAFPEPDCPKLLKRISDAVRAENPHLILFGGDFVHGTVAMDRKQTLPELTAYLKTFSAPLGRFAVLGNHELWHDRQLIRRSVEAAGCPVLTGEVRSLRFRGQDIHLLGIDDFNSSPKGENSVPEAIPETGTVIALAHAPGSLQFLPPHRNILMFSGHTHGGQIRIPGAFPLRTNPFSRHPVDAEGNRPDRDPKQEYDYCYDKGLYQLRGNRVFVSSGVGGDRITARLGCFPEIVFATLRCPGKASAPERFQQLYETRKKEYDSR